MSRYVIGLKFELTQFATLSTLMEDHCGGSGNGHGLLYYLNLATSFDTTTSNLTALVGNISKAGGIANNIAPTYRDGVMFANDNELYLYGGLLRLTDSQDPPAGNTVLGYERYQYGPDRQSWQPGFIIDNLDSGVTRYVTNGAGVSAPSENLGFYFSGMRGKDWGPIYVDDESANVTSDRMIKVDMSTMRENKWSNLSLPAYVPPRANSELVWIPVAEDGVLVVIGGVINSATIFSSEGLTSAQQNASKRASPRFMETVPVYDVSGERWYLQNTTGDIPPQLTQFCSVYASAQDGSSHNIYIYGGYDGLSTENTPSDDVYVLSLPSFSWIKLYSGNSPHGRSGHRCVKPYPDQMFVLGGVHLDPTHCLDGGVVQVFNLNTGRFQNTYSPTVWSEYKVPDLVTAVIGGDSKGGATKVSPASWTNSSLADVFKNKYTKTISTWYPYNSTASNSPTITPVPAPDKGSSFPSWAGAIIGVILGLILITAAVIFWCVRRRRRPHDSQSTSEQSRRSWILRWMHAGGGTTGVPKSSDTTASTGYSAAANEPNITPATAVSPWSVEAGGDPVYEMLGHTTTLPVELPTPYNNNVLPSPVSTSGVSGMDYVSPVTVSTPSTEGAPSPVRPLHHRHVSSLSTAPSIVNVMREESGRRQTYRSDISEGSVDLERPRGVELSGSTLQEGRLETTREVDEVGGLGIKELP
ncbi:kelch repeat-containing protein 2 [Aspergillus udagawae]|nr:kelch repeat-containing protein 2 [Aspergillus udagawae]